MAIKLEFFDIIIPIKTIKKKYPGGWTQCLKDHNGSIGGKVWYDDHLFRDGAMSANDINYLVEWWSDKGFDAYDESKKPKWLDFCVVQSIFGGPTLPCDWIEVRGRTAHLKNQSIGHLVGSESQYFSPLKNFSIQHDCKTH